ncbi:MAG: DUF5908 family protein [Cyclobacteriaceae bacterium]|nr:DUF5908 family protein [Cyclobacteriaceae bacterium]
MPIEIKELIVKAIVDTSSTVNNKGEKENASGPCECKDLEKRIDLMLRMINGKKER